MPDTPLDNLEIKITSSSDTAVEHVEKLAASLEKLDKASQIKGLANTVKKLKALGDVSQTVSVTVDSSSIRALEDITQRVAVLQRAIQTVNATPIRVSGATGRATTTSTSTRQSTNNVETLDVSAVQVESQAVEKVTERVSALGRATRSVAENDLAAVNNAAKQTRNNIDGIANFSLKNLNSGMKLVGKGVLNYITNPFKNALKMVNKWKSAIGRVAFYRLVRTAIKMVTEGFKEGIDNLYYFSSLVGTQFAPAMDSLASSSQYLKNSLGAMAAPLIQSVAPAVTYLIDLFVSLLNVINMVFSVLSGRTYTKALKTSAKYADDLDKSLGGGASAAKELKRYLIGIDELNIMPEQDTGGGGGGGSDLGSQYEEMFEEVPLPDWVMSIKDAIDQGDWYGAGELLAEKINSVIAAVDFEELGQKLGGTIQKGIDAALGFVRTMDWKAIGADFAGFLNGMVESIDPNSLGALIASKINIAFGLLDGFVTEFNWVEAGAWLGNVVTGWANEIDIETVAHSISTAISGAFKLVAEFFKTADFEEIGRKIGTLLANLDWEEIFRTALSAAGSLASGLLGAINGLIQGIGIDLGLSINNVNVSNGGQTTSSKLLNSIAGVLGMIAAGSLTFSAKGTGTGKVLGAFAWFSLTTKLSEILFDGVGEKFDADTFVDDLIGRVVPILAGASLVLKAVTGVSGGAAIGITLGVALSLRLLSVEQEEIDKNVQNTLKNYASWFSPDIAIGTLVGRVDEGLMSQEDALKAIHDAYGVVIDDYSDLYNAVHYGSDLPQELKDVMELKVTFTAVADKIDTSSLPEEQRELLMKAVLETVDDKELSPEYKTLVMDAVVKTIDSTALNDVQKSIVVEAIIGTVNSTQLGINDKTLIMTALLDAVDDGQLSPESKKILMDAQLTGVIDAISPEKKVVNDAKAKYTGLIDGISTTDGKTIENGKINVRSFTDFIQGSKDINNGNLNVSTLTDTVQNKTINNGNLSVNTLSDGVADKVFGGGILSINQLYDTVGEGGKNFWGGNLNVGTLTDGVGESGKTFGGGIVNIGKFNAPAKKPTFDASARFTTYSSGFSTNPTQNVVAKAKKYTAFSNNPTQNVVAKAKTFTAIKKNPTQNVVAKATSLTNGIKSPTISVAAKITSIVSSATNLVRSWLGLATGGIFAGGQWQPIAGYASGGNPRKARLFYANENGMPELVGQIGGHTAVMNNGQIVASVASGVYQAVSAAMGSVGGYFASIANGLSRIPAALSSIEPAEISPVRVWDSEPSYASVNVTARSDPRYNGADGMEASIRESNEDMINALYAVCQRVVTAINEKDTTITLDRQEVGRSVTRQQNRMTTMYGKRMVEA